GEGAGAERVAAIPVGGGAAGRSAGVPRASADRRGAGAPGRSDDRGGPRRAAQGDADGAPGAAAVAGRGRGGMVRAGNDAVDRRELRVAGARGETGRAAAEGAAG